MTPDGDFQLIARVNVGFAAAFDAGVLYLHVGEREWAKLCLELSPADPTICTVVTRGRSDDANAFVVDGESCWLRLSRNGSAFAFHASADGEKWTFVRVFALGDADWTICATAAEPPRRRVERSGTPPYPYTAEPAPSVVAR